MARIGRLTFPISMLAFPFYLMSRSPGKQGSHYDPKADLFVESEEPLVSCAANPQLLGRNVFLGHPVLIRLAQDMVPCTTNVMA